MTVRTTRALIAGCLLVALFVGGCGTSAVSPEPTTTAPASASSGAQNAALEERLRAIDDAVRRWRASADLTAAQRSAEEARNLVTGPEGPGYGDADGDGAIAGASGIGLLPGLSGTPGLATPEDGPCVVRDTLGGDWTDPPERWAILEAAIAAWRPSNNTFPSLPSHPQRVVGWATLTLSAADLETAVEYGGHANLHIDIALRGLTDCPG